MNQAGFIFGKSFDMRVVMFVRAADICKLIADLKNAVAQFSFDTTVVVVLVEAIPGFVQQKLGFQLITDSRKPRAMPRGAHLNLLQTPSFQEYSP
ncbi:hypothetical protein BN77_p11561 [Rhizobium mesoamericanum STM3625]|uniref:Uncharacterized protein n=1 Tax=Rhizobium mesoamericanum STM3625 TaxID=1211777 RepID=K0PQF4_9HYPH|nr:hypothetical protein BN77_p11561 [Rhizobium mesoamericanum STM3625]